MLELLCWSITHNIMPVRYQPSVQVQAVTVSTGASQNLDSLAQRLRSFSNRQRDIMSREQAALYKSYADGIENDVIETISRLAIENERNYEQFEVSVAAYEKQLLSSIKESEYVSITKQIIDNKRVQYGQDVYRKTFEFNRAMQIEDTEKNINITLVDTENMLDSAIRQYHTGGLGIYKYFENMTPLVQQQLAVIQGKIDGLLTLGVSPEKATSIEEGMIKQLFQSAAMTEVMVSIEKGSGWDDILSFYRDPTKFFSSREHLNALFPQGVKFSDEESKTIFKDMMMVLNDYQTQQDYQLRKQAEVEEQGWNDNYSNYLDLIVEDPDAVTPLMIAQALKSGTLGNTQHDALLKLVQSGGLYQEDPDLVVDLQSKLFDPTYSPLDLQREILTAAFNGEISPATQQRLLTTLRSNTLGDITRTEDYQMVVAEIRTEFRTTGPLAAFDQGESRRISQALRELYRRVQLGERPLDIADEIKEQYGKQKANASQIVLWNPNWVGSAESPDNKGTQTRIGEMLAKEIISEAEASKQLQDLKLYMKSYEARMSR